MTQKLLSVVAAIAMMFAMFTVSTADVDAQTCTSYNGAISCGGPVLAYPSGGFSSSASASTGATSTASTATTAGTAETTQGLAFTGVESQVLGYVGAGLIGLGGLSLVAARRRSSDTE